MNTILVTGGTGYIGSHTVVELQNNGYEVVIVDDLSNSQLSVLDGIERITGKRPIFYQIDICDKQKLEAVFNQHNSITGIIHFAAKKVVNESVKLPLKYYRNNIDSLLNLLEISSQKGIYNFVFSSSCAVYGETDTLPVVETMERKKAISPYGNTKSISEDILKDCCYADSRFKCAVLRYFNPIGAHPSSEIGELPIGVPQNLIPYITQTVAGIREKLCVYGSDYDTPDGTCIRDYIHVVDLAKAHVAALAYLEKNPHPNYDIFNIGTGRNYSVLETIRAFEKVTGKKVNYEFGPRREGDIIKIWADPQKANKVLRWKAEEDLESMLLSAWKWQEKLA